MDAGRTPVTPVASSRAVRSIGIAVLLAVSSLIAFGTDTGAGAARQDPGETAPDGRTLLRKRWEQIRRSRNPYEMREIMYRMQREQRAIRLQRERESFSALVRRSREENRDAAAAALQRSDREPDPEVIEAQRRFDRKRAALERFERDMSTPLGRIRTFIREFTRAQQARPDEDAAEVYGKLARAFTGALSPARTAGGRIAGTPGYIRGTVGYAGEPDSALTLQGSGYVMVFDRFGFPVLDDWTYVSSWYTDWALWVNEPGIYYPVLFMDGFALLYWDGAWGTMNSDDAIPVTKDSSDVTAIDFRLSTGASFEGRITSFSDPQPGARTGSFNLYEATGDDWWYWQSSIYITTDIDTTGTYKVRGIEPGSYYVLYDDYTSGPRWYDNADKREEATPLIFADRSQALTGIDFTLYEGWTVTGRAFHDDAVTPLGAGITSGYVATVTLKERLPEGSTDVSPFNFMKLVYSWDDSYFTFWGVPPGEYTVLVEDLALQNGYALTYWEGQIYTGGSVVGGSPPGPLRISTPDSGATFVLTLADSTYPDTLAVVMDPGASLQGQLLKPDSTGFGFAGILAVREDTLNAMSYMQSADAGGNFLYEGLPAGSYHLYTWATPQNYYYVAGGGTYDYAQRGVVTVTPGKTDTLGVWRIIPSGAIAGTVEDSTKGTGVGGMVSVFDQNGVFTSTVFTYGGEYLVEFLEPGTYYLYFSSYSGYPPELYNNAPGTFADTAFDPTLGDPLTVAAGDTARADIFLEAYGVVEGTIKEDGNANFNPWEAEFEVWDAATQRRLVDFDYTMWYGPLPAGGEASTALKMAATDSVSFRINGLEPGTYKVRLRPVGMSDFYGDSLPRGSAGPSGIPAFFFSEWPAQFYKSGTSALDDGAPTWGSGETVTIASLGDTVRSVDFTLEQGGVLQGFLSYPGADTVGVSVDSLAIFVVLFDAATGEFVDTHDADTEGANSFAGGFRFHSLLPGTYKLAALGIANGQAGTWYTPSGPVTDISAATPIAVTGGAETEIVHRINPSGQGAAISGSVHMLGPEDPSLYSMVFAYTAGGYPAGLGYSGEVPDFGLSSGDFFTPYSPAEAGTAGSFEISGLEDGTYYLRTWSPELLFEVYDEYYSYYYYSSPAADGPQRHVIPAPPAWVETLQDMWWNQVPAGSLHDYFEWEPEFATATPPTEATPATISGGTGLSGFDFYLAVLASGDPNGDGVFDIGDVISLVNAILGIETFGANQVTAADLNGDGVADIGDVISMIISLLGGSAAAPGTGTPAGEYLIALGIPEFDGPGVAIPVWTRFRRPLAGLQFTVEVSGDAEVVAADLPAGFTLATHREGDRLRVLIYSADGVLLPAEETRLLKIVRPGATRATAGKGIRFGGARGATASGQAFGLRSFGIGEGPIGLGTQFSLEDNWPNPFNPTTTIAFTLPRPTRVRMHVYNIRGQLVKTLIDREMGGGRHTVQWDGTDGSGRKVATGIYLYTLEAGSFHASKKMLLVK